MNINCYFYGVINGFKRGNFATYNYQLVFGDITVEKDWLKWQFPQIADSQELDGLQWNLLKLMIWLVVWNIFYFPIYWECHHPNWLPYLSEGWPNHQPAIKIDDFGGIPILANLQMVTVAIFLFGCFTTEVACFRSRFFGLFPMTETDPDVCNINGNIYHQYTPNVNINLPYIHGSVMGSGIVSRESQFGSIHCGHNCGAKKNAAAMTNLSLQIHSEHSLKTRVGCLGVGQGPVPESWEVAVFARHCCQKSLLVITCCYLSSDFVG